MFQRPQKRKMSDGESALGVSFLRRQPAACRQAGDGLVDGSVRRARRIDVDTTALSGPDPVRKHDRSAEGLNPRRDYFGSSVQKGGSAQFLYRSSLLLSKLTGMPEFLEA